MGYVSLKKVYYSKRSEYENEYKKRKNGISCVSLGLNGGQGEMFFVYTPEMVSLLSKILTINAKIERLYKLLPGVACDCYSRNCLVDEIMMTNDIEGVRSTRKEIIDVIEAPEGKEDKHSRFEGLIQKYLRLLESDEDNIPLSSCKDIRLLYDEIVLPEIDDCNKPDGEIFRKDSACVVSATQQEKHKGIIPEAKIVEYMSKVIEILNSDQFPLLIRIAAAHYLIGYIHPFYDGNGRLSRFISSYMLQKDLNILIALRLAYTIKNDKSQYYKAFDLCNDVKNRGDVTPFILMFLEMLDTAATSIYTRLDEGLEALNYYNRLVGKIENADERNVIFFLIQNKLFASEKFDIQNMANLLKCSYGKATKILDRLIREGVPIKRKKPSRKYLFSVDLNDISDYLEKY
ncbi:Fic family protein [bacterium 210820-DFI.6.37]|nr:Fic family protein [bacterium 210820-DFI.6.37]